MKKLLLIVPLLFLLAACGPRTEHKLATEAFMAVDNSLVYMVQDGKFDGLSDREVNAILDARNIAMDILREQGRLAAETPPRGLDDYLKERFNAALDFMKSILRR